MADKPLISGSNFIGSERSAEGNQWFYAYDPSTGEPIDYKYFTATKHEVDLAMAKALDAARPYGALAGKERAAFLEAIAKHIEISEEAIIQTAISETGLPAARLSGEKARTTGQIRMFAQLIREGSWVEASIADAIPNRLPAPKPDIRKMLRPVGPIVVFGSSNFPLAFSVAGGDTISALAAGNPVIVKAHPAHPGTSELVANCVIKAALDKEMPEGTFSMLFDSGYGVGQSLVLHPHTRAVGFTGSFTGGMALYKLAQSRPDPIPVFAEMGSVNPVFILPGSCASNSPSIASMLAGSISLGAGQFCTNPGLIFIIRTPESVSFLERLTTEISKIAPQTMLTRGIAETFSTRLWETLNIEGVNNLSPTEGNPDSNKVLPVVATVPGDEFQKNPKLAEEVFGPFSLVVLCRDSRQMADLAETIGGQLTATVFHSPETDQELSGIMTRILSDKAGRIIYNGVPTGVEVCPSMHHGGPFPASTDGRFSSVGTSAIKRFARPVAFQDCPEHLLPEELKPSNPLKIFRMVNGQFSNQ